VALQRRWQVEAQLLHVRNPGSDVTFRVPPTDLLRGVSAVGNTVSVFHNLINQTEESDVRRYRHRRWAPYPTEIGTAFGGKARHGVLVKNYVNPEVGRYAPPDLIQTHRIDIEGIDDLATICTSHIERHNLSVRTFMRRFTRLTLGFSKKLDNLKAAVAIHVAYYNFCWRLRLPGKSGKLRPAPAMDAGPTDRLWSLEDLYDAVMEHDANQKRMARYKRLADALRVKG
jgi:hypothetical protein